jgi:phosphoglucosamine mutase
LVVVDENGDVVHGDKLIGALAVFLHKNHQIPSNACVTTVMSNIALEKYLHTQNIKLYRANVGDKYVLEMMKKKNINFGGEQSGHIIFANVAKTGDGLASALQVLAMILQSGKKASEILNPFELSPQILKSFIVKKKIPLEQIKGLKTLLKSFKNKGLRELIRYSGTENKIRLLLEGSNKIEVENAMTELSTFIKNKLC